MPSIGLILPSCLVVVALLQALTGRLSPSSPVRRAAGALAAVPAYIWLALGVAAFVLPVFEYWVTGKSHGNALAGFLPWADATEYYQCSQTFLLGMESADHCGKRSYYVAFFASLLWLTGNNLQTALLLQALIVGAAAALLVRELARDLGGPAALGAYAVLYGFAAALCAGLVMTENAGFLLGTLGVALLWRSAQSPRLLPFLSGTALLAAGVAARPGPFFVIPALAAWYLLCADRPRHRRLAGAGAVIAVAAVSIGFIATPILIAGGTLGSTHSNFSYALYGLAAGGKSWVQAGIDHPEIYTWPGSPTDRVYALAIERILASPHLFVLGYLKGVAAYFDDLFRFATEFKPLRLAGLLLPWILGVWYAARRWRNPRCAMLLWLQAGILASAPFIIVDETNRDFAATMGVDAGIVGLGFAWIAQTLGLKANEPIEDTGARAFRFDLPSVAGLAALLLPLALLALFRPSSAPSEYAPPTCAPGQDAAVIRLGRSALILPLVAHGEEGVFPLRVRADLFQLRLHRRVHNKHELSRPPGTSLVWATRLEHGSVGKPIAFSWNGDLPARGEPVGVCVQPPPRGSKFGAAVSFQQM